MPARPARQRLLSVYGLHLVFKHSIFGFWIRLLTYIRSLTTASVFKTLDPDGLFARWLPIGSAGYYASDILGFCQRRFDLLAIKRLVLQSSVICSFTDCSSLQRF